MAALLCGVHRRPMSSKAEETDAEFDARYEAFFNRKDIDGWEIRKAMHDLNGMDLVPEPAIVAAALRACRRINDYSLTTRILEVVKIKTCDKADVWAYMLQVSGRRREKEEDFFFPLQWRFFLSSFQELRPTLDELGISTPEELGYDKPELWLPSPYDVHG